MDREQAELVQTPSLQKQSNIVGQNYVADFLVQGTGKARHLYQREPAHLN
ncbi:hypothetical protein NOC27_3126 [Nitrosococcus oceani AFC27]|nr:hypothetical protein NOC27_3126 [Nitrosococcus oceani AFC27]